MVCLPFFLWKLTFVGTGKCSECLPGWFGSDCASECPFCGSTSSASDSLHRVCDQGANGTGECKCVPPNTFDRSTNTCIGNIKAQKSRPKIPTVFSLEKRTCF